MKARVNYKECSQQCLTRYGGAEQLKYCIKYCLQGSTGEAMYINNVKNISGKVRNFQTDYFT